MGQLADSYKLSVADRRAVDSYLDAIMKAQLNFAEILRQLKREDLQRICDELGLDRGGRECEVLVGRILGEAPPSKMTWRDAVLTVLREKREPTHYGDLADEILSRGLVESETATPANTVYTTCVIEMRREKPEIMRVGRGLFSLVGVATNTPDAPVESWIQSLGVLWRRDWVRWTSNPKLRGSAPNGVKAIDFSDQRGVYILYDGARPVYAGRVTDRPLGKRLGEHVNDRLGARWDRFSWFGLRPVTEDGDLGPVPSTNCSSETFIGDLEAVLIEALEPPLNRRRGDDFEAKEYRQIQDEEERRQKLREAMEKVLQREPD